MAGLPVFRQSSCPVTNTTTTTKPAVAPKPVSPAVPPKPVRLESRRIVHLPPSGVARSPSSQNNGRVKPNMAFINDLQQAMSQKKLQQQPSNQRFPAAPEPEEQVKDRPFPNRFSSGEYENVQQNIGGVTSKILPPPPLPTRNGESLSWNRN
jgi:hypothetical protein